MFGFCGAWLTEARSQQTNGRVHCGCCEMLLILHVCDSCTRLRDAPSMILPDTDSDLHKDRSILFSTHLDTQVLVASSPWTSKTRSSRSTGHDSCGKFGRQLRPVRTRESPQKGHCDACQAKAARSTNDGADTASRTLPSASTSCPNRCHPQITSQRPWTVRQMVCAAGSRLRSPELLPPHNFKKKLDDAEELMAPLVRLQSPTTALVLLRFCLGAASTSARSVCRPPPCGAS